MKKKLQFSLLNFNYILLFFFLINIRITTVQANNPPTGNKYMILKDGHYVEVEKVNATCDNITNGGEVCCNESQGNSYDPAPITNVTFPSGGTGALEYQWLYTTNPNNTTFSTWTIIVDGTSASYDPGIINKTTYYVRCARRAGCTDYVAESNIVIKAVSACSNVTNGGEICCNESLSTAYDPEPIKNLISVTGGTGSVEYRWDSTTIPNNTNFDTWNKIPGTVAMSYDPSMITQTTYYVRRARRVGCTGWKESNIIIKEVAPPSTVGKDNRSTNMAFYSQNHFVATLANGYVVVSSGKNEFDFLNITHYDANYKEVWSIKKKADKQFTIRVKDLITIDKNHVMILFDLFGCDIAFPYQIIVDNYADYSGIDKDYIIKNSTLKGKQIIGYSAWGYVYTPYKSEAIHKIRLIDGKIVATFPYKSNVNIVGLSDSTQLQVSGINAEAYLLSDKGAAPIPQPNVAKNYTIKEVSKDFYIGGSDAFTLYHKKTHKALLSKTGTFRTHLNGNADTISIVFGNETIYYEQYFFNKVVDSLVLLTKGERALEASVSKYADMEFINSNQHIVVGKVWQEKSLHAENDIMFVTSANKPLNIKNDVALSLKIMPENPTYTNGYYNIDSLQFTITNLGKDVLNTVFIKHPLATRDVVDQICDVLYGEETKLYGFDAPPGQSITKTLQGGKFKSDASPDNETRRLIFYAALPNWEADADYKNNLATVDFKKAANEVATEDKAENSNLKVYYDNSTIFINTDLTLDDATLAVYDMLGRVVYRTVAENGKTEYLLPSLPQAIYIAQLTSKSNKLSKNLKFVF